MADEETPKKKKSKLKWIILLLLLLMIGGGGAGAWFFFLQDKFMGAEEAPEAAPAAQAVPETPMGTTVTLPPFTVNLADPAGQRFIRINLAVEVADAKVVDEVGRYNARIRDSIILLLSSKAYADVATPESKLILKNEITDRLNSIMGPGKVYHVFITDMVIQ